MLPASADVYFFSISILLYPDGDLFSGEAALTPGVYPLFFEGPAN